MKHWHRILNPQPDQLDWWIPCQQQWCILSMHRDWWDRPMWTCQPDQRQAEFLHWQDEHLMDALEASIAQAAEKR